MLRRLLNVEEAAQYLGIKKSTLYDWAWKGKIAKIKMGRRLVFDIRDLDALIELNRREVSATINPPYRTSPRESR